MTLNVRVRKFHRQIALLIFLPFLIIVVTGCLLQTKRWIPALQPARQQSPAGTLDEIQNPIGWEPLLTAVKAVPEANVQGWSDIKAIEVRPSLGVARIKTKNGYEVQIDLASGNVLSSARGYSSWLIEIHEGAIFGNWVRNGIFVPSAFALLMLTGTGLILLVGHYGKRFKF